MATPSTATSATGWSGLSKIGKAGVIGLVGGTATGLIGAYFSSQTEKYKTKSLALQYEHKRDMALFNRRMKESQAWHLNDVYNKRIQIATLKAGQRRGKARAMVAARGIQMGVGSTKDAFVSDEIMKDIDRITMNSNKVRAVEGKRLEAVGLGIQADAHGLSASYMFATASSINPWMNMSSTLLTGANTLVTSLPSSFWTKQ